MDHKRVLLIGRRREVLDKLSGALTEVGFIVHTTNDIEGVVENHPASNYDLMMSGAGVDDATKAHLKEEFLRQNPGILILDGFAPIIPLLADQVKYAFREKPDEEKLLDNFNCEIPDDLHIYFSVKENCSITLELFYFDYTNGQTYQENLLSGPVEKRVHIITARKELLKQGPSFIVMKINEAELLLHKFIIDSKENS